MSSLLVFMRVVLRVKDVIPQPSTGVREHGAYLQCPIHRWPKRMKGKEEASKGFGGESDRKLWSGRLSHSRAAPPRAAQLDLSSAWDQ